MEKEREEMQGVIDRMIGWLEDHHVGTRYGGMTYEQGIRDALEWAMGEREEEKDDWPFTPEGS